MYFSKIEGNWSIELSFFNLLNTPFLMVKSWAQGWTLLKISSYQRQANNLISVANPLQRVNGNRSGRCWKHCPWVRTKKTMFSQWKDIISEKGRKKLDAILPLNYKRCISLYFPYISSVQFSPSVLSDSLRPHGLQHTRLPCPSPAPGACSNSCPLSQWCHPTILSSVVPFSSCLQSCTASGAFPNSHFFTSGGQSIGASASVSVLLMIILHWFPFGLTGLISLAVQRTLKSLLHHHNSKTSILWFSAFFIVQLSHPYVTAGKTRALTRWTFVSTVMCLLFNMLSRLVITFLPRSKHLLISWLQSPSAVILEPKKIKPVTVSTD